MGFRKTLVAAEFIAQWVPQNQRTFEYFEPRSLHVLGVHLLNLEPQKPRPFSHRSSILSPIFFELMVALKRHVKYATTIIQTNPVHPY